MDCGLNGAALQLAQTAQCMLTLGWVAHGPVATTGNKCGAVDEKLF